MEIQTQNPLNQESNRLPSVDTRKVRKLSTEKELLKPSRKIQKKRSKYKKIDDTVRIQLFEAVKQRGEMLKTAANRLKINYSSAKSIFHTFRKEGRICKKSEKLRASKTLSEKSAEVPVKEEEEVIEVELDTGASEESSQVFTEEPCNATGNLPSPKTSELSQQEEMIKNMLYANITAKANLQNVDKQCADSKNMLIYLNSLTKSAALVEKVKLLSQSLLLGSMNELGGYTTVFQEHLKSSMKSIIPSLKELIFELQMIDCNTTNLNQPSWMPVLLYKALQQLTPNQLYSTFKPSMSD